MAGRARAELIADGAASAAADEFFRAPAFLAAEGATHTLRVESPDRTALVPLVVREIEGGGIDATSTYGYPGATLTGAGPPPSAEAVDWSATGLVSVFARERVVGDPWLAGALSRSRLLLHDPALERSVRPRLAEQIRANAREGWEVRTIPGPGAGASELAEFATAYEQTMRRVAAAQRYFFETDYLAAALGFERAWLLLARRGDETGAGAIAGVSDGILHYFLGGTADAAIDASPFKNVVAAMLDLADELGLALNLGGGVEPGDGLERFKRGFANREVAFRTHEVICDRDAYARLAGARQSGDFFPAYRA